MPSQQPPYYRAELPWIGPLLGDVGPEITVAGASDPVLGDALVAALAPVVRRDKHFALSGPVRAVPIQPGERGRFRLRARREWWQDADGLLLVLLYDRSAVAQDAQGRIVDRLFPDTWHGQLRALGASVDARAAARTTELPAPMHDEIERGIAELLQRPAKDLEVALIEPPAAAADSEIVFAVASCQYPAGLLDQEIAERSYCRLKRHIDGASASSRPQCLLLVGDQVYLDPTAGFFDAKAFYDRYDLPYERLLTMEPLRHVLRRVPLYTMLDDHEIEDNWERGSGDEERLREGVRRYWMYQRMAGPRPSMPGALWYAFKVNGFPFFMCDTRTQRDGRTAANVRQVHIMDDAQFDALHGWLREHEKDERPKFIVSPASLLPRHRRSTHGPLAGALHSDGWDGYPASFDAVVDYIAKHRVPNVVFLSGDAHISFAATAIVRRGGAEVARLLSVHSSALYAPFTFANSAREQLHAAETFRSGNYEYEVSTWFAPPGDGFTLLRASEEAGRWRIRCLFDREGKKASWVDFS